MPTHRRSGRQPIHCRRNAPGDLRRSANRTPRKTRPGTGRTQRAPTTRGEPEGHGWTHRPGRRGARPEKPWPTEGSTSAEDRQVEVAPTQPDRACRARGSKWWSPRSHPPFAAEAAGSEPRLLPLYCPKAEPETSLGGGCRSELSVPCRSGYLARSRSWRFRGQHLMRPREITGRVLSTDLSGVNGRRDPVKPDPAVSRYRLADLLLRVCQGGREHPSDEETLAGRCQWQIRGIHEQPPAVRSCRLRPFRPQEERDRMWARRRELRREIQVLQFEAAVVFNQRSLDRGRTVVRRRAGQTRKEDVFGRGRSARACGPTRRDQEHKHEAEPCDALRVRTTHTGTLEPHRDEGTRSVSETHPPSRRRHPVALATLAETGGFEPPGEFHPSNRLAGGCFRPLSHVSADHPSEARAR